MADTVQASHILVMYEPARKAPRSALAIERGGA